MDKQQRITISILSVILLVIIVVTARILITRESKTILGEFQAPPFDDRAVSGAPVVDDSLNYREVTVAEGFKFSMCGNLTLNDNGCLVYFTSPSDNKVWLLVKMYDVDGNLLGQSNLLRPGEYIENIELSEKPDTNIPVKLKILSYEPNTYYSQGSAEASFVLKVKE